MINKTFSGLCTKQILRSNIVKRKIEWKMAGDKCKWFDVNVGYNCVAIYKTNPKLIMNSKKIANRIGYITFIGEPSGVASLTIIIRRFSTIKILELENYTFDNNRNEIMSLIEDAIKQCNELARVTFRGTHGRCTNKECAYFVFRRCKPIQYVETYETPILYGSSLRKVACTLNHRFGYRKPREAFISYTLIKRSDEAMQRTAINNRKNMFRLCALCRWNNACLVIRK